MWDCNSIAMVMLKYRHKVKKVTEGGSVYLNLEKPFSKG